MKAVIHLHKKRREKNFHPNHRFRVWDDIVMFVAIIFPFTTLPQILKIWLYKNAEGLSLITWSLYFLLSIPFIIYGILHRDKPIIIMYALWMLVHASVVIGILLYG